MTVPVLVLVKPRESKLEETWKLVPWLLEQVKENEPYISTYRYWRAETAEGMEYIIYFEIDKEESLKDRWKLAHHQEVKRRIQEEDMLREPFTYRILKDEHSFTR